MPIRLLTKKQHVYGGRRYQPGDTYLARTVSDARTLKAVGFVVLAPEPVAVDVVSVAPNRDLWNALAAAPGARVEPLNDTLPDLPPMPESWVELDTADEILDAAHPDESESDTRPTDPPKRKRGRPRKIQTPEG